MTDAPDEPVPTESTPIWVLKTAGYVFLGVFATLVAVNAVQTFFVETANLVISGILATVSGATIAVRRRHLLARFRKQENTP